MGTDDDTKTAQESPLVENIRREMEARGFNQKSLALAADLNETAVRDILKGKSRSPRAETISKIAGALGVSVAVLMGEEPARPPSNVDRTRISELPPQGAMRRDLEVRGIGVGGNGGDFTFNGSVVDYVRRPPALESVKNAFAIYLRGDSMEPRYEEGDLLYVHPGRPVKVGRDVLVELHGEHGQPGDVYVKRLVRRTADKLILQQYNPPCEIEIPMARVRAIYPILSAADLMGV